MILFAVILALQDAPAETVRHPQIACWTTPQPPAGSAPGLVMYDTTADAGPFRITHNRDHIRESGRVGEDYNFIDYWFGDPAKPLRARYYLNDDKVSAYLPGENPASIEAARAAFPADVLCYLQKRFGRIEVLVESGYVELWTLPE